MHVCISGAPVSQKPHGRGLWGWENYPTVPTVVGRVGAQCGIRIMPKCIIRHYLTKYKLQGGRELASESQQA